MTVDGKTSTQVTIGRGIYTDEGVSAPAKLRTNSSIDRAESFAAHCNTQCGATSFTTRVFGASRQTSSTQDGGSRLCERIPHDDRLDGRVQSRQQRFEQIARAIEPRQKNQRPIARRRAILVATHAQNGRALLRRRRLEADHCPVGLAAAVANFRREIDIAVRPDLDVAETHAELGEKLLAAQGLAFLPYETDCSQRSLAVRGGSGL